MVSREVAGDNRRSWRIGWATIHCPISVPGQFRRIESKQLFGSTSITGKAIFFQVLRLSRAEDGRASLSPSQFTGRAEFSWIRLEAAVGVTPLLYLGESPRVAFAANLIST
jgi:hypothetical protein